MKRLAIILIALALLCGSAWAGTVNVVVGSGVAAVPAGLAIDSVSTGFGDTNATSTTVSHTCSGSDRVLYVATTQQANSGAVTGVTYNGDAMSSVVDFDAADTYGVSGWVLAAPDTGTHDIVVSYSSSLYRRGVVGISFTGAHQTTSTGTPATSASFGTSPSIDVSASTGDIVVDMLYGAGTTEPTIGADQTQRGSFFDADSRWHKSSTQAGAATTTMSWTTDSGWNAIIGVAIKAK